VTAEATPTQDPAALAIITAVAIAAAPARSPVARSSPSPVATPVAPSKAVESSATDLATKLTALNAALRSQDTSTALKVQGELLTASDEAETALKTDKSTQAQSVRAAIADIRAAAAGGDTNGFEHAAAALRLVNGAASGGLGITSASQNGAPVIASDVHTLADQVRGMRKAVQSHNTGEALRLQGQLVAEVAVAQAAVAKDESDSGKTLRSALSDLDKGLHGDATRLAAATAAFDKLDVSTDRPGVAATTDVSGVALALGSKIDAFRAAASTGSRADLLRLQQEILADADQAAAGLTSDQSPSAADLKRAVDAIRAGVSGDLTKLDGARADLAKMAAVDSTSTTGTATSNATASGKPIADLSRFAADLDNTVNSFQAALEKNDTGTMLRLQRQLSEQAAQVDSNLKDANSKPADEVRAAVASIRTAFAGDVTKLDEAHVHLRTVSGTTATQPGSQSTATKATPVSIAPVGNALRDRASNLAMGVRDHQSADEIAKRRDALKAEITQAEAALNGANDPRADRLRSALGAAREAAGGDDSKAAGAQTALEAALAPNGQ
jgi:hypothetical protein